MKNNEPTVFIVDDDDTARDSVRAIAESMGVRAEGFSSAEAFLAAYDPARPGCLVTDVCMLGMSGVELQGTLNRMGIRIPTVVISGYADVPVAVQAMKQGAITLLEKPYAGTALRDAIRDALAQDASHRAAQARRAEIEQRFESLTRQEREVLDLMLAGTPNKIIAAKLHIGLRTVEARRKSIFEKTHTASLAELIQVALEAKDESHGSTNPP